VAGWCGSLVIGLGAGIVLVTVARPEDGVSAGVLIGLIVTTTALGTVLPILRDSGDLDTRLVTFILSAGAVGEFGPILAVALLLSGQSPLHTLAVLVAFALVAALALGVAARSRSPRLNRLLGHTLKTSGQLGELGLDVLLGAFTAGVVARVFLSGQDANVQDETVVRLEGVGYGFLVPIFFVVTGIRFDLDALLADPEALLLLPLGLLLFLLVRGVPTYLSLRGALEGRERLSASIYAATALPLVVVITAIGVDDGRLTEATAAGLVGAGMLSVLLFPLLATRVRGVTSPPVGGWADASDAL
jgi:Kef-type K+ transport system membrane component KefB